MEPAETEPGSDPSSGNPLPDASNEPRVPPEERLPFHGKMATPTVVPSAAARKENLRRTEKAGRRKKFLWALLGGQVFVLLLDLGGEALLHLLRTKVQYRGALPLRSMVFLGMTSTILAMGLLVFLFLGYRASRYAAGERKVGVFRAIWIGIRRVWNEAWALGLILGVIGGTAWFLIPAAGRTELTDKGVEVIQKGKGWVQDKLHLSPATPPPQR